MKEKADDCDHHIECHTENITRFPAGCRIKKSPDRCRGNRPCRKPQTPGKSIKRGAADQCGDSFCIFFQCGHDDLKGTIKQHGGKSRKHKPVILQFDIIHGKQSGKGDNGKTLPQKNKFDRILFIRGRNRPKTPRDLRRPDATASATPEYAPASDYQ